MMASSAVAAHKRAINRLGSGQIRIVKAVRRAAEPPGVDARAECL
jgi:hypothetical protein